MNNYKVVFKDNKATDSAKIDCSSIGGLRIEHKDGKGIIKWLLVNAESEEESMQIANEIVCDMGFQIRRTFANSY